MNFIEPKVWRSTNGGPKRASPGFEHTLNASIHATRYWLSLVIPGVENTGCLVIGQDNCGRLPLDSLDYRIFKVGHNIAHMVSWEIHMQELCHPRVCGWHWRPSYFAVSNSLRLLIIPMVWRPLQVWALSLRRWEPWTQDPSASRVSLSAIK